jgi:hypothetical protein
MLSANVRRTDTQRDRQTTNQPTNCMEKSPSLEADGSSAGQQIPRV